MRQRNAYSGSCFSSFLLLYPPDLRAVCQRGPRAAPAHGTAPALKLLEVYVPHTPYWAGAELRVGSSSCLPAPAPSQHAGGGLELGLGLGCTGLLCSSEKATPVSCEVMPPSLPLHILLLWLTLVECSLYNVFSLLLLASERSNPSSLLLLMSQWDEWARQGSFGIYYPSLVVCWLRLLTLSQLPLVFSFTSKKPS